MKKHIPKIYVIFFAVFFILPSVIFPILSDNEENFENRNMTEKPSLSLKNIESFPSEYENYYNDNLPFRNDLIKSNALLNLKVFKQSPEKKVIIGDDGWLFYNPPAEDSDPIGQCTGKTISEESLLETANNLISIRDALKSQDREFIAMLCPNKESIYGADFLPKYYNASKASMGDQLADYIQKNTDINFVYPKKSILDSISKYPQYDFYYKLDTHWNYLGGYLGARELFSSIDITLPTIDNISIATTTGRVGDLSNMTGVPEMFGGDISYTVDGYTKELPNKNSEIDKVTTFVNENGNGMKVLVIRDSFSEGLYPYLNSTFSQTDYIHITEFYSSVIDKCDPDIVILQVVERYLGRFGSFKIG